VMRVHHAVPELELDVDKRFGLELIKVLFD
jgi:hypothetical protein